MIGNRSKRYGLKLKNHMHKALLACLLLVIICALTATTAEAQMFSSLWGSSAWWDWSDFRASMGYKMTFPRITGTVEGRGETHNLSDFGFSEDPEIFKAFNVEFYIDRLGLRLDVEEDHKFKGRTETIARTSAGRHPVNGPTRPLVELFLNPGDPKISDLDFSGVRLGLDLDIIRTPFARGGIDFTYYCEQITFTDRRHNDPFQWQRYTGSQPLQLGVHGRLMPGRIRDVPITIQGKFRLPFPFTEQLLRRTTEAKITEWEISAGLRPAIWEMSFIGHSTFSFGIEGGYRMSYLNLQSRPQQDFVFGGKDEVNIHARWGGAFVQVVFTY